jgi:hypothetical protein
MRCRASWITALASVILAFSGLSHSARAVDLLNDTNTSLVSSCQQPLVNCSPRFAVSVPMTVQQIVTYHQQVGPIGAVLGKSIGLLDGTGSPVGTPSNITMQPATPGIVTWVATVQIPLVPGIYTVIDNQQDTWIQNGQSCDGPNVPGPQCNKGFAIVTGITTASLAAGGATGAITDCLATCTQPSISSSRPHYSCSAHGPAARCGPGAASADNPGGGVICTDGKNTTTCNCQFGCTTR